MLGSPSIEQNERGSTAGHHTERAQILELTKATLLSCAKYTSRSHGTDTGHAQQLMPIGRVELDGSLGKTTVCPREFRILFQWKVAVISEGKLIGVETVAPDQEVTLIQAVLAYG